MEHENIPLTHTTSRLIFIYKKSKQESGDFIDELRPISVTSVFFKIIE